MKRCEIRLQKCGINTDKNKNSVKTSDLAIQCSHFTAWCWGLAVCMKPSGRAVEWSDVDRQLVLCSLPCCHWLDWGRVVVTSVSLCVLHLLCFVQFICEPGELRWTGRYRYDCMVHELTMLSVYDTCLPCCLLHDDKLSLSVFECSAWTFPPFPVILMSWSVCPVWGTCRGWTVHCAQYYCIICFLLETLCDLQVKGLSNTILDTLTDSFYLIRSLLQ